MVVELWMILLQADGLSKVLDGPVIGFKVIIDQPTGFVHLEIILNVHKQLFTTHMQWVNTYSRKPSSSFFACLSANAAYVGSYMRLLTELRQLRAFLRCPIR